MVGGSVRWLAWLRAVALPLVVAGCYTMQPVASNEALVGTRVVLHVNDAGRVALGRSMGQEIDRVEGQLLEKDSATFLIAVKHVFTLRGGVHVWSDESVRIRQEYVGRLSERQLSKGRTIAFSALGAGSVAFLLSRGLLGSGLGDPTDVPADSGAFLRMIWP